MYIITSTTSLSFENKRMLANRDTGSVICEKNSRVFFFKFFIRVVIELFTFCAWIIAFFLKNKNKIDRR